MMMKELMMKMKELKMIKSYVVLNFSIIVILWFVFWNKKVINEIKGLMYVEDNLEFAKKIKILIDDFPKFQYLKEEMESIKENIIDVYDGYESRTDSLKYMNFMQRVMINSLDYMKDLQ